MMFYPFFIPIAIHGNSHFLTSISQGAFSLGFPGSSVVKNPPASTGDSRLTPGWGRSLEECMETHSSTFAWRRPWTEAPGGLSSMRSQSDTTS